MAPSKHTKSHSDSQIISPLSDPKRLVREASFRRRLEASSSYFVPLQPKDISSSDPFRSIPYPLYLDDLTPRVLELLSKAFHLQSTLLVYSLESYKIPEIFLDSPKSEEELDVHLTKLKPTNFISPTHYTFPSTSTQSEEFFFVYSNPLFENKEEVETEVQKLVMKTNFKIFRDPPPSSPPPTFTPPSSPTTSPSSNSSSTTSSSTYSSDSSSSSYSNMATFQPIIQARYTTLHLPSQLNNFLEGYLKHLPRFNGETGLSIEDHLVAFLDFDDNMNIEHQDVYMRLFVQSLEGNVRILFRQLRVDSIHSLNELTTIFKN